MRFKSEKTIPDRLFLSTEKMILGADVTDYELGDGMEAKAGSFIVSIEGDEDRMGIKVGERATSWSELPSQNCVVLLMGKSELKMMRPQGMMRVTGPFLRSVQTAALRRRVLKQLEKQLGQEASGPEFSVPRGRDNYIGPNEVIIHSTHSKFQEMIQGDFSKTEKESKVDYKSMREKRREQIAERKAEEARQKKEARLKEAERLKKRGMMEEAKQLYFPFDE